MKTVLFAIAMRGLDSKNKSLFEEKTVQALKLGSRDFVDINYSYCDYKEGLRKACDQYMPDCLVVNENLIGTGNIFEIIKDIKSDYPDMVITVLLTKPRVVGDVILANLTASGIYNWIVAPWTPEAVANSLITPRKMKDVQAYIPKIVEGTNGLAFETKYIENIEDNVNDLSDILDTNENNALSVGGKVSDLSEKSEAKQNIHYRRVINQGFGFGKNVKPIITAKMDENKDDAATNMFSMDSSPENLVSAPAVEEKELPKKIETPSMPELPKAVHEEAPASVELATNPVKEEIQKPLPPRVRARNDVFNDEVKAKLSNAFSVLDAAENNNKPSNDTEFTPKVKPVATVEETVAKKNPEPVNTNLKPSNKQQADSPKESVPGTKAVLKDLNFVPKYKKILFIRALPLSSVVPVHVAKLMNASFVDFNKVSNNDGYMEILRTTIKEAKMPDAELVVGDVVAGNGVEKLVEKFDHVIALLPDDPFAIKQFVSRYPGLYNGVIIDKCTTASITRKQLLSMIPDADYIDSIKVDNCNREVVQSSIEHTFLLENEDFAEGMKFFLKDISGGK